MGRGRRVEAILSEFPEPSASQLIVRVSGTPGSNLLRVEDASGSEVTVRLPSKTKNTIWVRTGGFLIINASTDVEEYGDVAHFLYKDQIRYLQTRGLWPAVFATGDRSNTHHDAPDSEESDDDDDLMPNPNHARRVDLSEDEEEDEEEEEEGGDVSGDVSGSLSQVQRHGESAPLAVPQLGSCASSGRTWRLWAAWHCQGEAAPLGVPPRPRVLEPAASVVADFAAPDPPGGASPLFSPCAAVGLEPSTERLPTLYLPRGDSAAHTRGPCRGAGSIECHLRSSQSAPRTR